MLNQCLNHWGAMPVHWFCALSNRYTMQVTKQLKYSKSWHKKCNFNIIYKNVTLDINIFYKNDQIFFEIYFMRKQEKLLSS
jgi:hypothetical protein